MSAPPLFDELIRRVRLGDADAARSLVEAYEPAIRRSVRFRLGRARLRSVLDSVDICQSVFASFVIRAAHGEYDLDTPEDLQKLLVTIARNKLTSWVRKESAGRRDRRKQVPLDSGLNDLADETNGPATRVAEADLVGEVRRRLAPDERELVDLRARGMDWDAIAEKLGVPAVNLRKKLSRALGRITRDLGLEDGDDG